MYSEGRKKAKIKVVRQNTRKETPRGKSYEKGKKLEENRNRDRGKVQEQKAGTWNE